MKKILSLICQFCVIVFIARSQKLNIDKDFHGEWPMALGMTATSSDGQYVCYGSPDNKSETIVSTADSKWQAKITKVSDLTFASDNKHLLFKTSSDSLFALKLGSNNMNFVVRCNSFRLISIGEMEYVAYQSSGENNDLVFRNISTGKEIRYLHVLDYKVSSDNRSLVLKTGEQSGSGVTQIKWAKFPEEKTNTIWEGKIVSDFIFDNTGTRLAFVGKKSMNDDEGKMVWYYSANMPQAVSVVSKQNDGIEKGFTISDAAPVFSRDGSRIFFRLQQLVSPIPKTREDGVQVEIWHHSDQRLQSEQTKSVPVKNFTAVIDISSEKVLRIERDGEKIMQNLKEQQGDFILFEYKNDEDAWWTNPLYRPSYYLASVNDGSRKYLFREGDFMGTSPGGRYVVWYDFQKETLFCYDEKEGSAKNLSKTIPVSLKDENWDEAGDTPAVRGFRITWFGNDEAFLVQDNYDIWQIDPNGQKPPVNITNGYGRAHHIRFSLADENYEGNDRKTNDKILLCAFDRQTKYSGFFGKQLGKAGDPELLTMGPFKYKIAAGSNQRPMIKQGQGWVVERMSDREAPNFISTTDFKKFTAITNEQPQQKYNWLKSELLNYKLADGTSSQAILYKPENFDSTKKYPVLFNYYQKKTDNMYQYQVPERTWQEINIPYFVSHGYLVVLPDMYYKVGSAGDGAVQSIEAAVNCLSKLPYVDTANMGIDGCSWGGYETNYIVTHTHLFSAAAEMAGPSDLVSMMNDISLGGNSNYMTSSWQLRVGPYFGEAPDLYIKNSPIFSVSSATTPLLMVNNKADGGVPWKQGVEFYLALRNCGKAVWMLQYDKGGHALDQKGKDAEDYTMRLTQFYDHYLKGTPAPKWMTKGVPQYLKGIESGYELDPTGCCRKDCPVCKKWNETAAAKKIKRASEDQINSTGN